MACEYMADGFCLDTFFLSGEEKAENFCPVTGGWACGGRGTIEGLLADEELEISEEEKMVGCFGAAPAVFSWPEEEE